MAVAAMQSTCAAMTAQHSYRATGTTQALCMCAVCYACVRTPLCVQHTLVYGSVWMHLSSPRTCGSPSVALGHSPFAQFDRGVLGVLHASASGFFMRATQSLSISERKSACVHRGSPVSVWIPYTSIR